MVGAGAAGMTAAGFAARRGLAVTLVERNSRPGRKLGITGKGRCNVTNQCDITRFLENVPRNPKFLYSAVTAFGPDRTMAFFEGLGVSLKVERGHRVFPVSDRAADIVDALARFCRHSGCHTVRGRATALRMREGRAAGVELEDGRRLAADAVILCTGGVSYPATGSTGDGYELARQAGHTVVPPMPSLVPVRTAESWPAEAQGLSLRHVALTVTDEKTKEEVFSEVGEMLLTHFGVSGPLVLSASAHMRQMQPGRYRLHIDLKPGLTADQLDRRLQRDFLKYAGRELIHSLHDLLPASLIPVAVRLSGLDPCCRASQMTREMRRGLAAQLKDMSLTAAGFRPVAEAIVTSGGVSVREIDPKTMESRRLPGLYIAGELLDVDGFTGGYNLQIAFSTGYAAGNAVPA